MDCYSYVSCQGMAKIYYSLLLLGEIISYFPTGAVRGISSVARVREKVLYQTFEQF